MKRAFLALGLSLSMALGISFSGILGLDADARPGGTAASKKLLPGYVAKENIDRVNKQIDWHTSLGTAQNKARQEGKMILWVQMIGKMDGAT